MEKEKNKKMYRLRYFDPSKPREASQKFTIYTLPVGMAEEESFQVLSYLIDNIGVIYGLSKNSYELTEKLNYLLYLEYFFEKVINIKDENAVIELFIVNERENKMGYNRITKSCFDWYTPNIDKKIIEEIYLKLPIIESNSLKLIKKI